MHIARLLRLLHAFEDSFLVLLLSTMITLAFTQIILRNFFDSGLSWIAPALRLLVLWVGLVGAMIATRQEHHIAIDILMRSVRLPERLKQTAQIFVELFTSLVTGIITYHAVRMVIMDREAQSIAFAGIPIWICELIIPAAFAIIALRYLLFALSHARQLFTPRVSL